jgi:serine/threonine protein phosphatase PrpC
VKVTWEVLSDKGSRTINEDAVKVTKKGKSYCFVLADGLGAHEDGEMASSLICDCIAKYFMKYQPKDETTLKIMLDQANNALISEQKKSHSRGLRTTVVVLIITPTQCIYGSIGDSRMYHIVDGTIMMQTKDHSLCQKMVDLGMITKDQIRNHEDRHKLMSVMGEKDDLDQVSLGVLPAYGDFLLCSDGLWEKITEEEIEATRKNSFAPFEWLQFMMSKILEYQDPSQDNISAIAISIKNKGKERRLHGKG